MFGHHTIRAGYSTNINRSKKKSINRLSFLPYLLILPLLIFIIFLSIYPTALTLIDSFFNVNPLNPPVRFSGFNNYISVLSNSFVVESWVNTGLYMLIGVALSTIFAVGIAIGLKDSFKGRAIVLAILILPWALPGVVEGTIWSWIYDPNFGVLNSVFHSLHLTNNYHVWLSGNRILTVFLIELVQVWQITPLSAILILASLQSIPSELYEAVRVDGASKWKVFTSITLPLIRPGLTIAMVESLIASLNVFDQVYVLNGNASTGASVMLQTYNVTFGNLNFGQGYALSFMAVVVTMVFSVGVLKFVYRKVEF